MDIHSPSTVLASCPENIFTKSSQAHAGNLPEAEAYLECQNKQSLSIAFSQAQKQIVSLWLFANPDHLFHHHAEIPPDAFDNSLAIHGHQRVFTACGQLLTEATSNLEEYVDEGKDLLLLPVQLVNSTLLGYSFGGVCSSTSARDACPHGSLDNIFMPHFIGRFSYDVPNNDLLIVAHGVTTRHSAITSIRGAENRERSIYVVPKGDYGYRKLPDRLVSMRSGRENRVNSQPKYQFGLGNGDGNRKWVVEAMCRLERMVKGDYVMDVLTCDEMDENSGEILNRRTKKTEARFDVKDAVGMGVFRDMATRSYYSYMSAVRGATSQAQSSVIGM